MSAPTPAPTPGAPMARPQLTPQQQQAMMLQRQQQQRPPFACLACGQAYPLSLDSTSVGSVFGCQTCQSTPNSGKIISVTRGAPTWHWSR